MNDQLLTPNQQLGLWLFLFILIPLLVALFYVLLRRQLNEIQRTSGQAVIPLWQAAWEAAQSILTHDSEPEADALMVQARAELETKIPMPAKDFNRLEELLIERVARVGGDMRHNEADAALAYPHLRNLALKEALQAVLPVDVQLVSTQQPENQSDEDKAHADQAN